MNDLLSLFNDHGSHSSDGAALDTISAAQRSAIRSAFARLGILDARSQFAVVEELTGQRITSVGDLKARHAQTLIYGLEGRVANAVRKNTGNSWDDREQDTWIDKL
jgi:hypothetical protein